MAVTHKPIFTQTPKFGFVTLSAANTARDGTGTIATLYTAGTDGAYVKKVTFTSAQTTAAANSSMVGRLWLSTDGGTTWYLRAEVAISAVTASNTAVGAVGTMSFPDGLLLPANAKLGVTISVRAGGQDDMDVVAEVGDY